MSVVIIGGNERMVCRIQISVNVMAVRPRYSLKEHRFREKDRLSGSS